VQANPQTDPFTSIFNVNYKTLRDYVEYLLSFVNLYKRQNPVMQVDSTSETRRITPISSPCSLLSH